MKKIYFYSFLIPFYIYASSADAFLDKVLDGVTKEIEKEINKSLGVTDPNKKNAPNVKSSTTANGSNCGNIVPQNQGMWLYPVQELEELVFDPQTSQMFCSTK